MHDWLAPIPRDLDGRLAALSRRPDSAPAPSSGGTTTSFDDPTSAANRPRWTAEEGSHYGLRRLIERDEPVWKETVRSIAARGEELERAHGGDCIPETADDADPRPRWRNAMMAGLDGVAIGVHDIFLPDDDPEEWAERSYSEPYVLAAWLLGAETRYRVTLPACWVSRNRETLGLDAIPDACGCPRERFDGCSFWIEKTG